MPSNMVISLRGVEILQAASQDYPDNMIVRLAVAGAYARVGRSQEAVVLFKSLNMNDASAGDFQGAISAAISSSDMAQAETWLRIALAKYPNDPIILGLSARFEQARGNNERAAAFWRAAIAAMPPGSGVKSLDYGLVMPPGTTYHTPSSRRHQASSRSAPGSEYRPIDQRRPPRPAACLQAADSPRRLLCPRRTNPCRLLRSPRLPVIRYRFHPAPTTSRTGRELRLRISLFTFPRPSIAIRQHPAPFLLSRAIPKSSR